MIYTFINCSELKVTTDFLYIYIFKRNRLTKDLNTDSSKGSSFALL